MNRLAISVGLDVQIWIVVVFFAFAVIGFIEWMRWREGRVEPDKLPEQWRKVREREEQILKDKK